MNSDKITTILMALTVGAVIGHHADDIVEKNYPPLISSTKHPLEIEYKIIKSCVNFKEEPLSYKYYIKKEKICICSLKKLELATPKYYELEQNDFLDKFEENSEICIAEIN